MKIKNISCIKLVCIAIGFSLLLISLTPQAATTSWKSPSENSGDFQNPEGAYSDGQASATAQPTDQHQYWGYNFNLPNNSTIEGIEVRIDGRKTGKGNVRFQVELSWDGGNSWTTGFYTNYLTNQEQTYILGSRIQTWGHTWGASGLSDSNFRVKITAVGSKNSKLDWIPVRVYYTTYHRPTPKVQPAPKLTLQALQASGSCTPSIYSSSYEDIESTSWNISGNNINITVVIDIKQGGCGWYWQGEYVRVWIDWNGDHDFFDSGERVLSQSRVPTTCPGTMTFSGSATIRNDAVPCTGLRTALRYGGWPTSCGSWYYGDYEDYQISLPSTDYSVTDDNLTDLTINQTDLDQWFGVLAEKQQSVGSFDVTVTSGQDYQVNACYEVSPTPAPSFSGDPLRIENPEDSGTFTWIKKCSDPNTSHLLGFDEEENCPNGETNTYPTEIDLSKLGDRASGETFIFTIDVTVVNTDT